MDCIHGNISQIPDIYFVNEFFIQKKLEFLVEPRYTVGRTWTNKHFFLGLMAKQAILHQYKHSVSLSGYGKST